MRQTILHTIIGRLTERHSNRTEKAEEEMTPHQQQAEALFEEWKKNECGPAGPWHIIAFGAFCLEKSGWKKYPDEKPTKAGIYILKDELGDEVLRHCTFNHDWEFFWERENIIAWMPIPEYKP